MPAEPGRVFHISRVWGSRHGGSYYSQALLNEMHTKGWQVTLLAEEFADPGPGFDRVRLATFFQRRISAWPRKLVEILRIWRLVSRPSRALVIVQGDLPRLTYVFLQLFVPVIFFRLDGILTCPGNNRFLQRSRAVCRASFGVSCLWTQRQEGCMGRLSFLKKLGRLAFRLRDACLLRALRNFVGISQYVLDVHGRRERVLHPPHWAGLNAGRLRQRDLRRLIFCGRLEQVKGAKDAIRIVSLLPEPFHLEILGDGPERGRLGKLVVDLQLGHRVRFHGWADPATRDQWLVSAGVLLLPSLWDEAFGMAGMEAFAQGTLVVAYDVGGVSEWCRGGAGLLVACGDVRGAAAAVRQLTNDAADWERQSCAAKRWVALKFPVDRFGRELDGILTRVFRRYEFGHVSNTNGRQPPNF